jgi:RNA-directed DNA polymerase
MTNPTNPAIPLSVGQQFKAMRSKVDLASFLGIPLKKLTYYLQRVKPEDLYRTFTIAKRGNKGVRTIRAPMPPLLKCQRRIADALLELYKPRSGVHGFVRERSILTNADVHVDKCWTFRIDLKDFFPSIHFGRVRGLFLAKPFSFNPDLATLLAQICTHEKELPQGAPTSPIISNLVCRQLDAELLKFANTHQCHFSRYADDLTFSTNRKGFPKALAIATEATILPSSQLTTILEEHKFKINSEKTRLNGKNKRQRVTGLIVNKRRNVRREYVRGLRALLHTWKWRGADVAMGLLELPKHNLPHRPPGKFPPKFEEIVRGRVQFVGSVKGWDDPVYQSLATTLAACDPNFRFDKRAAARRGSLHLKLFAEGKTDYKHLKAAQEFFRLKGDFLDLAIEFQEFVPIDGSSELIKRCEQASITEPSQLCVFLFDCDEPNIVKKASHKETIFRRWANRAYSFLTPIPAHRTENKPFCIEMYYPDDVLKRRDANGRRIFLREEFNEDGFELLGDGVNFSPDKSALVLDTRVFDKNTKQSVSLSKNAFADLILGAVSPFDAIDFEAFRPLFEMIYKIVDDQADRSASTS